MSNEANVKWLEDALESQSIERKRLTEKVRELEAQNAQLLADYQETVAKAAAKERPAYDEQQEKIMRLEAQNAAMREAAQAVLDQRNNDNGLLRQEEMSLAYLNLAKALQGVGE